ncbi:MAG TPA: nuclear transport factor 2 family protein [Terriglobales bacterium]|nr:nuclear transport factor 2 family protein [Terriglobales bacterium]
MPLCCPLTPRLPAAKTRSIQPGPILMALPGFSLSFAPSKIVIAKADDMAYEIGTYHLTLNDAQGKPAASVGKYVVNWQKRGGKWKVVADIFNDDK